MKKKEPWILDLPKARMRFAKMSKEDRLKTVCRRYMEIAFKMGKLVGNSLKEKKYKATGESLERIYQKRINAEMTRALKKAQVLPLKNAA